MNLRPFDYTPDLYAAAASAAKPGGTRWVPYRHLLHIADAVTSAITDGGGRLVVNMQPRLGKSEFLSFWLPLWYIDNFPNRRVVLASYQSDIAIDAGRKVRNELESNPLCRARLTQDSQAAGRFHTDSGGAVFCAGVDGPLMGRGADLAVFDDPYKSWDEAFSPLIREKTEEWFYSTLYTRCEPGATVIITSARMHPDDLCGKLEDRPDWRIISLPALAGPGDPLGRPVGEALCPERYDARALASIRSAIGESRWSAMFQQAPTGAGTGRLYERFSARNLDATLALDPAIPLHISFDFNIRPGMHAEIGQYREADRTFIVTDEIHAEALDLAGALDRLGAWAAARGGFAFPEAHIFGDATGHARDVRVTRSCYDLIAAKLVGLGIPHRVRVPRRQPPIRDSVDALNDALLGTDGVPRFFVHPRCERLLTDFRELRRSADGLIDKTDQRLGHSADCARYWCAFLRPAGAAELERPMPKGRFFSCPQGGGGYTGEPE